MKVGLKRVFAATGGAPLDRLLDTTRLAAAAGRVYHPRQLLDSPNQTVRGRPGPGAERPKFVEQK